MIMLVHGKFPCLTILRPYELVFFASVQSSIHCAYPANYHFFYKEYLEAWSDYNGHIIATKQDVLNEIIWNNQNLLINKQSMYNKK